MDLLFCRFIVILFYVESEQGQTSRVKAKRDMECVISAALLVRYGLISAYIRHAAFSL